MKYNVTGLNKLSKQFNEFVKKAGFNGNDIPLRMMLAHSEISEAFEAFRKDHFANPAEFKHLMKGHTPEDSPALFKAYFQDHIKDSMEDELADSIIRLLDLCAYLDVNIEFYIEQKMAYNEMRGFKYGGKKF